MYYDEQVINGVLCHRDTPDGEWIPFTPKSLTISLITIRGQVESRDEKIAKLEACLDDIKNILIEN